MRRTWVPYNAPMTTMLPLHSGDRILLRCCADWARLDEQRRLGADKAAAGRVCAVLGDADWQAHGTPGLALLAHAALQYALAGVHIEWSRAPDDRKHKRVVEALGQARARIEDWRARCGLGGDAYARALGSGLAVASGAWHDEGRTDEEGVACDRRIWASLESLHGRGGVGAVVDAALAEAPDDASAAMLARGALGVMGGPIPLANETAWQPRPTTVAWCLACLGLPCAPGTAQLLRGEVDGKIGAVDVRRVADFGRRNDTVIEHLFNLFANGAVAWDEPGIDLYRATLARAEGSVPDWTPAGWTAPLAPRYKKRGLALVEQGLAVRLAAQRLAGDWQPESHKPRRRRA